MTTTNTNTYTIETVNEFEYTGGGIWVTCGYVRDTATGERFFYDSSIGGGWAEYVNVYTEYPYEPDDDEQYGRGCSFMPLPNYDDLFRDSLAPDDERGRALWREILASDAVPSAYRADFLDTLEQYSDPDDTPFAPDDSVKITRFACGDGFFCDIEETGDRFEAWLGHKDIGVRELMFGSLKANFHYGKPYTETFDNFCEIVEVNLPEYIDSFREDYMNE